MRIRTATTADLDSLVALAARTFPLACPADMPSDDIAAFIAEHLDDTAFRTHLADPDHLVLVAETSGSLIGYVLVLTEESPAYLSKCYVAPEAHGTGAAEALVTATVDELLARGARALRLGVNADNVRAQRFYAKQGFVRVGDRRFTVGTRVENDHVLERTLGA